MVAVGLLLQLLLDRALARILRTTRPSLAQQEDLLAIELGVTNWTLTLTLTSVRHTSRSPIVGDRARLEMIPDTELICQTSEAAVNSTDVQGKIKAVPEREAASVTAWKRYQQLVAMMESKGGKLNRKSMIEAIFRGSDLVYASH